jgi:hypothetical protein
MEKKSSDLEAESSADGEDAAEGAAEAEAAMEGEGHGDEAISTGGRSGFQRTIERKKTPAQARYSWAWLPVSFPEIPKKVCCSY